MDPLLRIHSPGCVRACQIQHGYGRTPVDSGMYLRLLLFSGHRDNLADVIAGIRHHLGNCAAEHHA
jgi:hypothetical protein